MVSINYLIKNAIMQSPCTVHSRLQSQPHIDYIAGPQLRSTPGKITPRDGLKELVTEGCNRGTTCS